MTPWKIEENLERIIYTKEDIQKRVRELAEDISNDYRDKDLVLVGILKGGVIFLSDLCRNIEIPHSYDMVGASSYGASTVSSGYVRITKDVDLDLKDKDVLLIEDIYDTGNTLHVIRELLEVHSPNSINICAFLYKDKNRPVPEMDIKYIGFHIPDVFVVGYGLDFNEKYRNLNCIGVLKKSVYS